LSDNPARQDDSAAIPDGPAQSGDTRGEAIDIYNHIDKKDLRESYLAHIPQLGI
jgi:hypothetical protein